MSAPAPAMLAQVAMLVAAPVLAVLLGTLLTMTWSARHVVLDASGWHCSLEHQEARPPRKGGGATGNVVRICDQWSRY